ncbi:hypothetical protein B7P43_G09289 [Cryptotermes secundus]|uniref:Uncharacterized protein n=1 Tax=Cryptotermes secundus TaxID=105785 RepID=A0A2J7Q5Z0_9NEOP|nr:uncharacterized protein LOC111869612 [Cryptotermes secundus]XP_023717030.1 uncharacterized protein LOC111869612 [Cryptotermes secundus]PNF23994.1 hypothetical protein B7P43_G09289 [Cryptotermes secundus]
MVFLESITTFCCVTVRRCACCKKNEMKSTQNSTSQTPSKTLHPIWTTDTASYDATSTITTQEAMSPSHTGILNHNFQPPGSKPHANLPDVTAASSMFPRRGTLTFSPQGQLCEDKQYYHNEKALHDEWYFTGTFTQDPRRSKEVTEL